MPPNNSLEETLENLPGGLGILTIGLLPMVAFTLVKRNYSGKNKTAILSFMATQEIARSALYGCIASKLFPNLPEYFPPLQYLAKLMH